MLVIPGLVNAHNHSYASFMRGMVDCLPLEAWFPYATAMIVGRSEDEVYLSTLLGAIELIRTGTTAVLDHLGGDLQTISSAAQAYVDAGLRVALAPQITDRAAHETLPLAEGELPSELLQELRALPVCSSQELVDGIRALAGEWHGRAGRISILVGPSGPQRASDELLVACRDLAEELDTGLHTHLLETRAQAVMAQRLYGRSMVEHLDALGLLSPRFSGAHAVWCSPADLELIAARGGTGVHNPLSNLYLGSGIARVPLWHSCRLHSALGTDGTNSGCNQNLFQAMCVAAVLHRDAADPPDQWPTPAAIFRMATEGSARALHMEGEVGAIEPGRFADLVFLTTRDPVYMPEHDLLAQLVYGETGRNIARVMVGGRTVYADGAIVTFDEGEVLDRAAEVAGNLVRRQGRLFRLADAQRPYLADVARRAYEAA
jgi:cytosine/adenosine deaminase-related metal-dependent hydrolase